MGDWDGDGRDNIAARKGNAIYMDTNFDGSHDILQTYGNSSFDEYLVGDWNGDGIDTLGLRSGSRVYMINNFDRRHDIVQTVATNGLPVEQFLVGDWV